MNHRFLRIRNDPKMHQRCLLFFASCFTFFWRHFEFQVGIKLATFFLPIWRELVGLRLLSCWAHVMFRVFAPSAPW